MPELSWYAMKRKPKQWIGMDLGGTKLAAAMVGENGSIRGQLKVPTEISGGWPKLRKQILDICRMLQDKHGKASGVGIGSAEIGRAHV